MLRTNHMQGRRRVLLPEARSSWELTELWRPRPWRLYVVYSFTAALRHNPELCTGVFHKKRVPEAQYQEARCVGCGASAILSVGSSGQKTLAGAARGGILWRSSLPCLRRTLGGVPPALVQPGNSSIQV